MDEAFNSIKTLFEHNPTAKVCLVTSEPLKAYYDRKYSRFKLDQVKCVPITENEPFCFFRTRLYELSPYDKTIALDADTYITSDIQNLFDLLDTFDFVVVPDESHPARGFIIGLKGGYAALNYYNTGFLLFRKSKAVQQLFENWKKEYLALAPLEPGDQGPLVRALIETEVRFITLPQEYNLRLIDKCVSFQNRVKIIHGRAQNPEKLIRMINDIDFVSRGSRVWIPNLQRVVRTSDFQLYGRLLRLLNWDNVQQAASGRVERRNVARNLQYYFEKLVALLKKKCHQRLGSVTRNLIGHEKGDGVNVCDKRLFDYMMNNYKIRSFFDCSSSAGQCAKYFEDHAIDALGLGGLRRESVCSNYVVHDMKSEAYFSGRKFDLVWCDQAAEHSGHRYNINLIETLTQNTSRFILLTHRLPGEGGDHNVNLQIDWYWIQLITDRGFYFDPYLTIKLRELSQYKYFKRSGLVFEKLVRGQ